MLSTTLKAKWKYSYSSSCQLLNLWKPKITKNMKYMSVVQLRYIPLNHQTCKLISVRNHTLYIDWNVCIFENQRYVKGKYLWNKHRFCADAANKSDFHVFLAWLRLLGLAGSSWLGWDFLTWLGLLGLAGTPWLSETSWPGWDFLAWLGLLALVGTSWPGWDFLAWVGLLDLAGTS